MKPENLGSTLESLLDETGERAEVEALVRAKLEAEVPRESMTHERFVAAVMKTRELVERVASDNGSLPVGWRPERVESEPTAWRHLTWMLNSCTYFHHEGKVQKANRWLGFVQGVLAMTGVQLEELKRANMPEGEAFDKEKT